MFPRDIISSPSPFPWLTLVVPILVLSFMSQFSGTKTPPSSSPPTNGSPAHFGHRKSASVNEPFPDHRVSTDISRPTTPPSRPDYGTSVESSPVNSPSRRRSSSRPPSMVLAHNPPLMELNEDTIPELLPVFSFLNSHSNKLYQEGYFLKLDDQNTRMLQSGPFSHLSPSLLSRGASLSHL